MNASELQKAVYHAAGRPEVREAIAAVYRDLETRIDLRKPMCKTSGRCCRFDDFGHRLYVTTIELAGFVYDLELRSSVIAQGDGGGCPFQLNGLCGVHAIRPFGCRI